MPEFVPVAWNQRYNVTGDVDIHSPGIVLISESTMSTSRTGSPEFQQFLQQCRRRFMLHTTLRGFAGVLVVALVVVLGSMAVDFVSPLPGRIRLVLLLLSSAAAIAASWKLMVAPLIHGITDAELGAAADLACPGFEEAVATVVSVEAPEAGDNEAGSQKMRARVWQQIGQRLQTDASTSIMDQRATLRRGSAAVAVLVVAAIPFVIWQSGSVLLLQRFLTPLTSRATATNLYFTVDSPGDLASRGSDVEFRVVPHWRDDQQHTPPREARVILEAESGRTDALLMRYDAGSQSYSAVLRGISDSVTWRVESGRTATADHLLNVVDSPQLIDGRLTVTPPDYTGFPPVVYPGAEGRMEVFAGSQVEIQLQFNKPVALAELVWSDDDSAQLAVSAGSDNFEVPADIREAVPLQLAGDSLSASLTWTPDRSGHFELRLLDEHQLGGTDTASRQLVLIPDQPPELTVRGIQAEEKLRPDDIIPVDCTAVDDTGIGDLELHLETPDGDTKIFTAPTDQQGAADVIHGFRVDASAYGLEDGDEVRLRVRVTDQRPPEPHEVWSDDITLTIDHEAAAPGAKALSEESRQLIQQLESVRSQLKEDTRAVRQLRNTPSDEWESRSSELTQLSERQQLLGRHLEELAEQADRHPLMKAPAQQLNQLGTSLRTETGGRLNQAAQQSYDDADDSLRQTESQLIDARSELEQIISQLDEAAELEQDLAELNRLALQAEQLAADAEALQQQQQMSADELPDGTDQEARDAQLQAQSEQIEETRRELADDLSNLLNEQSELQAAARNALLDRQSAAASQAAELAERQEQLATLMEYENAADPNATAAAQQQVAQDTDPLSNELTQISQQAQLPGVGLEDRSATIEAARQSAATASRRAAEASQSAADGELKEAAEAGSQAADALNRVAELGQDAAGEMDRQPTRVPQQAAQSVTRALQYLTESAEPAEGPAPGGQQPADAGDSGGPPSADDRTGSPDPAASSDGASTAGQDGAADASSPDAAPAEGDGTPSESGDFGLDGAQPASGREQQLAEAANALSTAAGATLPGSILDQMELLPLPGNMAGTAPTGADSGNDRRRTQGPAFTESQRDWARLHDELSQDVRSGSQESIDSRYSSMIRAYFRELARSSTTSPQEEE